MRTKTTVAGAAMLAVLFMVTPASAQEVASPRYINVSVLHTGGDRVGESFAYELREQLRASTRYDLAENAADAAFAIHLLTLDTEVGIPDATMGLSSAVAVTITITPPRQWPLYLTTRVIVVGSDRVSNIARSLLASFDKDVNELRDRVTEDGAR